MPVSGSVGSVGRQIATSRAKQMPQVTGCRIKYRMAMPYSLASRAGNESTDSLMRLVPRLRFGPRRRHTRPATGQLIRRAQFRLKILRLLEMVAQTRQLFLRERLEIVVAAAIRLLLEEG